MDISAAATAATAAATAAAAAAATGPDADAAKTSSMANQIVSKKMAACLLL